MQNFYKLTGIGNDFVLFDLTMQKLNKKIDIKKLCSRNFCVGGDGVLFLEKSKICDANLKIFNNDNSKAKMCGNALRCVAQYLFMKNKKENQKIEIDGKVYGCKILKANKNMAKVKVEFCDVNLLGSQKIGKIIGHIVFVQNLHFVVFVKNFNFDMQKCYKKIQNAFCDGVNVEFVKVLKNNSLRVKSYERGVGKTLACGSGAVACAKVYNKFTKINNIKIKLDGGLLETKVGEKIYLTGNSKIVFKGELYD